MQNNKISIPEGWFSINETPPDKYVEVIDADGRTAFAFPTYYPFSIEKRAGDEFKPYGWRGTVVPHEGGELKWDGGWMIDGSDFRIHKIGKIIGWKNILN